MPPPVVESDAESIADEATTTLSKVEDAGDEKLRNAADHADEEHDDSDDDEDEDGDEDEEIYIVEKIQDHRSDFEDSKLRYLVKWKGYESKKDRTWEPEENLEGAKDVLTEYWESLGGKPTANSNGKSTQKRRRQSGSAVKTEADARANKKQRASNNNNKEVGDDDWKPPPVKDGSWDRLVQSVDTVVRENSDGELWGYLIWNQKSDSGRYYRSKAKLPTIYKACPQRMLHFYEKHLVFSNADNADAPEEATTT